MEYYFHSTPVPSDAYTAGLVAGIEAMEKRILEYRKEDKLPEDIIIEGEEIARERYLKFVIKGKEYQDGESYYTMYTNKELEIKVEQIDTVAKDLSGIAWKLVGNKITSDKDDPTILRLEVKKSNLPKSNNELLVLDGAGNKISKLKIQTYWGPEIMFDESSTFNGEYLFDHGYEFNPLVADHESFSIGPNNNTYYAPVLGILQGRQATIRVNVKHLKSEANKDPNFSVVIKPELPGKIQIDGQDSLVLNANTLGSIKTIIVQAIDEIDRGNLTSMKIIAYLPSTGEQVGMMEYYCAEREKKEVDLIFVKFSDEKVYPNYLVTSTLETFLEDQSMNQLFLDFDFIEWKHNSALTTTKVQKWNKQQILDSLNKEYFKGKNLINYGNNKNYYYVTNLVIKTSSSSNLGAFHYTGDPGGVQMKYQTTAHGETAEEAAAHEFGHWLGLPHTWGTSKNVRVIVNTTQGGTQDNFMDYKIRRKKWFKHQLLKHNHK